MKAIYVRVSTEEQAKHGYSIKEQVRLCKIKADSEDVLEYIDEGITGEILDRPQLTKLRHDIKEGLIETVICYDPDRLSRKLMNQLIISEEIEKHATLEFVNGEYAKTPEGMLFYQLRGAVAEFEKAKITERMSHGRRQKARQGKVVRDFKIYGYSYDKETETFTINPDEAKVVKLIYNLFTKPNDIARGINGIAKYLTSQGIPTKKKVGVWHRQVVRQILLNEVYTGVFYQNRWNTEGMLSNKFKAVDEKVPMKERPRCDWIPTTVPTIIEKGQWAHAQQLLEESRRRWAGSSKNQYLLSGLLRCSHCGNTMTGRRSKNWGRHVYQYTCVKNTAGAKNNGCGHTVNCKEIDETVWVTIQDWLSDPKALSNVENSDDESTSFEEEEIERIKKDIERISFGKQRLLLLFTESEEDLLIDDIRSKMKELKVKENELQSRKKVLEDQLNQQKRQVSSNLFLEASDYYLSRAAKEGATFQLKKEILRMIVREIQLNKQGNNKIYTF